MKAEPRIRAFFDERTNTISYLVWDEAGGRGAIIDPVLDFIPASGEVRTESANLILAAAAEEGVTIDWVLETHVHADHLSAAAFIRERTGARVAISERIVEVQRFFAPLFGASDVSGDGSEFDRLLADGDRIAIGALEAEAIAVPGHTPADLAYRIGDCVFAGDSLFMPDFGTARTDFPGGDAKQLYRSIRRLLDLPGETRLFMCHDYKAPGRDDYAWETTVSKQLDGNLHLAGGVSEEAFVEMRRARDSKLPPPALLYPAIQVNIRAGRFPPPDPDGEVRLRLPAKLPAEAADSLTSG
ncbi:MAG TPA: MBL fold metallo-hydrolase [Allosphingosinicella sp.]|nr:MBL fold metallo-hydrolase [Allosphingosinicella sp.]